MTWGEWFVELLHNFGLTPQQGIIILLVIGGVCLAGMIAGAAVLLFADPKRFTHGCITLFSGLAGGVMGAVAFLVLSLVCSAVLLITFLVLIVRALS